MLKTGMRGMSFVISTRHARGPRLPLISDKGHLPERLPAAMARSL